MLAEAHHITKMNFQSSVSTLGMFFFLYSSFIISAMSTSEVIILANVSPPFGGYLVRVSSAYFGVACFVIAGVFLIICPVRAILSQVQLYHFVGKDSPTPTCFAPPWGLNHEGLLTISSLIGRGLRLLGYLIPISTACFGFGRTFPQPALSRVSSIQLIGPC